MVGAGSSKFMGYPLWDELVSEMVREFSIPLTEDDTHISKIAQAGRIKSKSSQINSQSCHSTFATLILRYKERFQIHLLD